MFIGRASAPANHLVLGHVEPLQPIDVRDLDRFPGNVGNRSGVFVDEMMMRLDIRIEYDSPLGENERSQQSFLDEQIQGVVNRPPRHHRESFPHA